MERRIYQLTEKDEQKAALKNRQRQKQIEWIESHAGDTTYWRRQHTTYGLAKRDCAKLQLAGDIEYYRGCGQGYLDQIAGLSYTEERFSPAYNSGYHNGYLGSLGEVREWLAANPNFDFYTKQEATK